MIMIDLFFNRIEQARGERRLIGYLKDVERYDERIFDQYKQAKRLNKLPSVRTLIFFDWLFTPDEMMALLEFKIGNNKKVRHSCIELAEEYINQHHPKKAVYRKLKRERYLAIAQANDMEMAYAQL